MYIQQVTVTMLNNLVIANWLLIVLDPITLSLRAVRLKDVQKGHQARVETPLTPKTGLTFLDTCVQQLLLNNSNNNNLTIINTSESMKVMRLLLLLFGLPNLKCLPRYVDFASTAYICYDVIPKKSIRNFTLWATTMYCFIFKYLINFTAEVALHQLFRLLLQV